MCSSVHFRFRMGDDKVKDRIDSLLNEGQFPVTPVPIEHMRKYFPRHNLLVSDSYYSIDFEMVPSLVVLPCFLT